MNTKKTIIAILIALLISAFLAFDLAQYLSLDYLKLQRQTIDDFYQARPFSALILYFTLYVFVTGLSLPGAAIMTLAGGAIFGLFWGTVVVSFASSIGATLAFLISRLLLKNYVQSRFGDSLATVNKGIEKDGVFYLFTLRLVPAFPFFIINLVMGLTPIRTLTFYLTSQIGMLAGTLVYVNAGTQLAGIESLSGILSPGLIISFVLLGIFPWFAKKLVAILRKRKPL